MSMHTIRLMLEANRREDEAVGRYEKARKEAREKVLPAGELAIAVESLYDSCLLTIQTVLAAECKKQYGKLELEHGRLTFKHHLPASVEQTASAAVVAGVRAKFEAGGWSVEHSYSDYHTNYDWLTLLSPASWPTLLIDEAAAKAK